MKTDDDDLLTFTVPSVSIKFLFMMIDKIRIEMMMMVGRRWRRQHSISHLLKEPVAQDAIQVGRQLIVILIFFITLIVVTVIPCVLLLLVLILIIIVIIIVINLIVNVSSLRICGKVSGKRATSGGRYTTTCTRFIIVIAKLSSSPSSSSSS